MANRNSKTDMMTNVKVSSYQIVHMKLGHVILGIVITIPKNEVSKFKENDNKLYHQLLECINDKLAEILQKEQSKKHEKRSKSKSKNHKYHIFEEKGIKFACKLEEKSVKKMSN